MNTKHLELIGTVCGILGAFLAASGHGNFGYPLFTLSGAFLLYTAFKQGNKNFIALQVSYLTANIIGIMHFVKV